MPSSSSSFKTHSSTALAIAFVTKRIVTKTTKMTIYASSSSDNSATKNDEDEERKKLLDMASTLRKEAEALETKLRSERGISSKKQESYKTAAAVSPDIAYNSLGGSTWKLTYRFSDEPAKDENENEKPVVFYRGQLTLQFKADGYTDLIIHEGGDSVAKIDVVKVWGWDEELSQEDGERYLLFSIDATTPTNPTKQRFYFQARIERDNKNIISPKEGTVTIKQDLAKSRGIMNLGFLSARGILAQFRYVGDFIAKPTSGSP